MNGTGINQRASVSLRPRRIFLCLLLTACLSGHLHAQYYNLTFRNYLSYNGIAQSEVDAIFEDSRGFLWIGTHFGLSRFDGGEFRNFYHHVDDALSIGDNEISAIDEDSRGTLWITLYNSGFCSFDMRTARFTNYMESGPGLLPSKKVEILMVDHKDRVWLGTDKGLSIFNPSARSFKNIPGPGEPGQTFDVLSLKEDSLGNVWIGTRNMGVWKLDSSLRGFARLADVEQVREARDIFLMPGSGAWIASSDGVFLLQPTKDGSHAVSRATFFPQRESLTDVEVDADGNLWMACEVSGVYIYFPRTGFLDHLQENFSSARGLLSNRMFEMYQDSRKGMWLGGENGLQYFQHASQKFNIYPGLSNISDELRGSTLYGIVEQDNDLIMASSGGILVYNRVSNRYVPVQYPHEYKPGSIRFRSLIKEATDQWWVCSDNGIYQLIHKNGAYKLSRPETLKKIRAFREMSFRKYLKKGNDFWFALAEDGLIYWNRKTGQYRHYRHTAGYDTTLLDDVINQMEFDREGKIMIGHNEGFSILDPATGTFSHIRERPRKDMPGLNIRYVFDMYDDGNDYWLATFGGGLNKISKKTGRIEYYTTKDGLCNDGIYTLMPENKETLWLGTAKGLSRFNIRERRFENFSAEDGLPSDEFNMLSRYTSNEGEIFMGTMNGLISFSGKDISKTTFSPRIYLSHIRIAGLIMSDSVISAVNTSRRLETQYGEGVYLEFSPMVFTGSNNMGIRYRVSGIDTAWRMGESGNLVPLIRTEPGVYTLTVQIFRSPGQEQSPEWTMRFEVKPPFWQTLPFRIFSVSLALFVTLVLIRSYIRRRLRTQQAKFEQEQAVEKERARISAELHDDIGGGLTAIRLMSEMLRQDAEHEKNRVYVTKISASSNELIQKMNEIVWALNINNDNLQSLVSYTREFAVSYLDDFDLDCHVEIPESIPNIPVMGTNRRDIFLLVKESLNNIVKHSQATEVQINFVIDNHLRINIQDNGLGFDPAQVRKGANGLTNMRKRVKRLKARMDIRSDRGTSIQFDIPLYSLGQAALA